MICTDTDHDVNTLATTKKKKKRKKKQTELSTHKKTEKKSRLQNPLEVINKSSNIVTVDLLLPLRKKCPYSDLFWSAFFAHFTASGRYGVSLRIQSEYGKMREKCGPE